MYRLDVDFVPCKPAWPRRTARVTFRADVRLPAMIDERTGGTTIWIVMFLAVGVLMVAAGLGWMAFGPPIT
jgi:hypothetical protein